MNNIGIDLNIDEEIKKLYKPFYVNTYYDKLLPRRGTNFETGYINLTDVIYLPHNTYIRLLFSEIDYVTRKKKIKSEYGKVIHYEYDMESRYNTRYGTAIVTTNYNVEPDIDFFELHKKEHKIIMFVNKDIYIPRHQDLFVQMVDSVPEIELFIPVRIDYGNPNTKMYHKYGYLCTDDQMIYSEKNLNSVKVTIGPCLHQSVCLVGEEEIQQNKTNEEYKTIRDDVMLAPDELELYVVYIVLLCITFLFKEWMIAWTLLTIVMLIVRKKLRDKYHLR